MIRFKSSIRARLLHFIMAFVVLVIGSAASTIVALKFVDLKAEELEQKWLAGSAVLGELADQLSEHRIAETYRALAPDPKARAEAELLAQEHQHAIQDLQKEYVRLLGNDAQNADMDSLRVALNAYYLAHDAWVKADTKGLIDDPAYYDSSSHRLYNNWLRVFEGGSIWL
jgi:hypothetical protein